MALNCLVWENRVFLHFGKRQTVTDKLTDKQMDKPIALSRRSRRSRCRERRLKRKNCALVRSAWSESTRVTPWSPVRGPIWPTTWDLSHDRGHHPSPVSNGSITPKGQKRQTGSIMITWQSRQWHQSIGHSQLCAQKWFQIVSILNHFRDCRRKYDYVIAKKTLVTNIFDEGAHGPPKLDAVKFRCGLVLYTSVLLRFGWDIGGFYVRLLALINNNIYWIFLKNSKYMYKQIIYNFVGLDTSNSKLCPTH